MHVSAHVSMTLFAASLGFATPACSQHGYAPRADEASTSTAPALPSTPPAESTGTPPSATTPSGTTPAPNAPPPSKVQASAKSDNKTFEGRRDGARFEVGYLGYSPPEVTEVRMRDAVVHQDKAGGANQQLMAVAGADGGGFALLWRDPRDGMLALYVASVSSTLEPRGVDRPAHKNPNTLRRGDPGVALLADGRGAALWSIGRGGSSTPWLRTFAADGALSEGEIALVEPPAPAEREAREGVLRAPLVTAEPGGGYAFAWFDQGEVRVSRRDANGAELLPPTTLVRAGEAPTGTLVIASDAQGRFACAWQGRNGWTMRVRAKDGALSSGALDGLGTPLRVKADPAGGWWVLGVEAGEARLAHLDPNGKADRELVKPLGETVVACDLVATANGPVLTYQPGVPAPARGAPRGRDAAPAQAAPRDEVHVLVLDAQGAAQGAPVLVSSPAAKRIDAPLTALDGTRLLVAWNDAREGNNDIWARSIDLAAPREQWVGAEKRLNSDAQSSDQVTPAVGSSGSLAWVVWSDRRDGRPFVYGRRLNVDGFVGDEQRFPLGTAPRDDASYERPEVAVRANGDALFVWRENARQSITLVAQIVGPDGKERGPAFELEAQKEGGAFGDGMALVALPEERGWLAAWARPQGIYGRLVAPDGGLSGVVRRLSEPGDAQTADPSVAVLREGARATQLVLAFGVHQGSDPKTQWTLRTRFLGLDGAPKGSEMPHESSRRNNDWDPAVAAAPDGGFALSWCSGYPNEPTRDVCARVFDAQGKAKGPILSPGFGGNEQDFSDLVTLPDGSFAMAWEDDISYADACYVRRIFADGKTIGPWMRIHELDTRFMPDRVAPHVAPLGDGWIAVYGDRRRAQGMDVYAKIVGGRFDDVQEE